MTHLHSTRRVFNSRRGRLRTQKASKPLAAGGDLTGRLHRSPGPLANPSPQSPTPAPSTSGFQLQLLGPKQLRAPKLLLNQGPSEPCYATDIQRGRPCSLLLTVHWCWYLCARNSIHIVKIFRTQIQKIARLSVNFLKHFSAFIAISQLCKDVLAFPDRWSQKI